MVRHLYGARSLKGRWVTSLGSLL
ncbi:hypothetical protein LINPERHAP1_LOCUS41071 [Linum perenne]